MERADCCRQLGEILSRETECAAALARDLEVEKAALTGRDPLALEQAVREKQHDAESLYELERRRAALIETAGFAPDRAGVEDCIRWCDTDTVLLSRWHELLALIGNCRDQNLVNGSLLELNRHNAERALDILRGQQPGARLYGPSGEATGNALSRTLGWV